MKRVLDKGTFTSGEGGQAAFLVGWLNDSSARKVERKQQAARGRIASLVDLAGLITSHLAAAGKRDISEKLPADLQSHLDELNRRMMRDYPPSMLFLIEPRNQLTLTYTVSQNPSDTAGEGLAARAVFLLAQRGSLDRVRRCICKKWFFAGRSDMRVCSAKCRHKLYEQTPEFKAKRRKYMRDYYRITTSGKVK